MEQAYRGKTWHVYTVSSIPHVGYQMIIPFRNTVKDMPVAQIMASATQFTPRDNSERRP